MTMPITDCKIDYKTKEKKKKSVDERDKTG